jgi:hypothetical protein
LIAIIITGCKPNLHHYLKIFADRDRKTVHNLAGTWEYGDYLKIFTDRKTVMSPLTVGVPEYAYTIDGDLLYYKDNKNARTDYKFKIEGDTLYLELFKNGVSIDKQTWTRRNYTTVQIVRLLTTPERPSISHIFILKRKELNKKNAPKNIIAGGARHWFLDDSILKMRKFENQKLTDFLYIKGKYYIALWHPETEKAYISIKRIKMDNTYIKLTLNDFESYDNEIIRELSALK